MGQPDGVDMDTEATKAFVARLESYAQHLEAWPQLRSRINALGLSSIGRRDRIAAAFDPGYREATTSVSDVADAVPPAVSQQAEAGTFAIGVYEQADAAAAAAMPGGR